MVRLLLISLLSFNALAQLNDREQLTLAAKVLKLRGRDEKVRLLNAAGELELRSPESVVAMLKLITDGDEQWTRRDARIEFWLAVVRSIDKNLARYQQPDLRPTISRLLSKMMLKVLPEIGFKRPPIWTDILLFKRRGGFLLTEDLPTLKSFMRTRGMFGVKRLEPIAELSRWLAPEDVDALARTAAFLKWLMIDSKEEWPERQRLAYLKMIADDYQNRNFWGGKDPKTENMPRSTFKFILNRLAWRMNAPAFQELQARLFQLNQEYLAGDLNLKEAFGYVSDTVVFKDNIFDLLTDETLLAGTCDKYLH